MTKHHSELNKQSENHSELNKESENPFPIIIKKEKGSTLRYTRSPYWRTYFHLRKIHGKHHVIIINTNYIVHSFIKSFIMKDKNSYMVTLVTDIRYDRQWHWPDWTKEKKRKEEHCLHWATLNTYFMQSTSICSINVYTECMQNTCNLITFYNVLLI